MKSINLTNRNLGVITCIHSNRIISNDLKISIRCYFDLQQFRFAAILICSGSNILLFEYPAIRMHSEIILGFVIIIPGPRSHIETTYF